jgi:mono/diheme cytochrome c family protein
VTNEITDLHTAAPSADNTKPIVQPASRPWMMARPWMIGGLVLLMAVCLGLLLMWVLKPNLDPYTKSVLQLQGNATQGRSIFVMNCVACHGQWANGKVGPSLRGVSERKSPSQIIHQVVSGETPPMPQFQPNAHDMADLLTYLQQL